MTLEDCIVTPLEPGVLCGVPDEIADPEGEGSYQLHYLHDPSDEADGITVVVPLAGLSHLPGWFGDWLVPGWLEEKVTAVFRALNKDLRKLLPSNREVVGRFLGSWRGYLPRCFLSEAVYDFLRTDYGLQLPEDAIDSSRVPGHLVMRYRVVGDDGEVLGEGRDLAVLQERLAGRLQERFSTVSEDARFQRDRLVNWSVGDLPEAVGLDRHTSGYPGLFDTGGGYAGLRLWPDRECAKNQHRMGVARLFRTVEQGRVSELEKVLFSGGRREVIPVRKPVPKARKRDAFGPVDETTPEPAALPESVPKAETGTGFLSIGHLQLLGGHRVGSWA